jgi:adenine-specific DNA-methyltransferase
MAILVGPLSSTRPASRQGVLAQVARYPRLRYMGSKYQVVPYLVDAFAGIDFESVVDPFSGSGVVSYALKVMRKRVTSNDYLNFPATVARATVENPGIRLSAEDIELIVGPAADDRDYIQRTFSGLYFPDEDHAFLDSAWSHIEGMPPYKADLAVSALCLAAARKQPRGVFTVTDFRYDDGRKNLRLPLRQIFRQAAQAFNDVALDTGQQHLALCGDVANLDPSGFDVAYFDPPYAPPRDDNDYIKRYHFLEGLSVYWRGQTIMEHTKTKKIAKRFTPYGYRRTIGPALLELFDRFRRSTLVVSYGSNSIPDEHEMLALLRRVKADVQVYAVPHTYSFGTHAAAKRRQVYEYIFVAR